MNETTVDIAATHSLITSVEPRAKGPPRPLVLLLPGLSGNNHQWDRVVALLAPFDVDLAFGAPILAHPTFSGTRPSVDELAHGMVVELRRRNVTSVVVVSHSVGSFVAIAMARELGSTARSVIAVNGGLTSVARFIDSPLRQLFKHPRECLGFLRLFVLVAAPVPSRLKHAIARRRWSSRLVVGKLVSEAALDDDDQRHSLIAQAGRFEILLALRDNRHHWHEFERYASEVDVETVFVVGDRDPMTSVRDTRTMAAQLPRGRVDVLHGVGHAAPLEAADEVVALIRAPLAV